MIVKKLAPFFFIVAFFTVCCDAGAEEWNELADKHFVLFYDKSVETEKARQILRRAEEYYIRIADRIGYSRYTDFWTWEERVKVIVYADQEDFVKRTGQPLWSLGYADRDARVLKSRAIVTYLQEENFFDGVLPHEISHLILRDFVGPSANIPLWFDEGVAQSQEPQKLLVADKIMRQAVQYDRHFSLKELVDLDVRTEQNKQRVKIFYAQSVSLVDFIIKHYGQEAFGRLCRSLGEGHDFEKALSLVYPALIPSLEALQKKWTDSLK